MSNLYYDSDDAPRWLVGEPSADDGGVERRGRSLLATATRKANKGRRTTQQIGRGVPSQLRDALCVWLAFS